MTANEIQQQLSDPFPPSEVGWKPQSVKGNRAMAIAYIDARNVMDRLDAVVGMGNWQDLYESLPCGSVICRLRVRVDAEWVTKTDVGSQSDQPDGGDRMKAAFSDALKRAAVKFGIGRYLYALPNVWCDYDPVKKSFVNDPKLPAWALPKTKSAGVPHNPGANGAAKPTPVTHAAAPGDPDNARRHIEAMDAAKTPGEFDAHAKSAGAMRERFTAEQWQSIAAAGKRNRERLCGTPAQAAK